MSERAKQYIRSWGKILKAKGIQGVRCQPSRGVCKWDIGEIRVRETPRGLIAKQTTLVSA